MEIPIRTNKITFRKNRTIGSGMPIGSKLIWNIKAKQYAIKVTPNKYRLIMH